MDAWASGDNSLRKSNTHSSIFFQAISQFTARAWGMPATRKDNEEEEEDAARVLWPMWWQ